MPNTKIEYLYRDGDNYKVRNEAVVAGEFTGCMVERIMSSHYGGNRFLPAQVGLPEERFGDWDEQSDGPWFELYGHGFSLTARKPTLGMDIGELADRFVRMAGRWEQALDAGGREAAPAPSRETLKAALRF